MHIETCRPVEPVQAAVAHHWVGAALVGMGDGDTARAEHAARTGRHVLPMATRIEVLEVYCSRCRIRYSGASCRGPCAGPLARSA